MKQLFWKRSNSAQRAATLLKEKKLCAKGWELCCSRLKLATAIFLYSFSIYISNVKETHKSCLSKSNLYWCHWCGGVCVLWMLLVRFQFKSLMCPKWIWRNCRCINCKSHRAHKNELNWSNSHQKYQIQCCLDPLCKSYFIHFNAVGGYEICILLSLNESRAHAIWYLMQSVQCLHCLVCFQRT